MPTQSQNSNIFENNLNRIVYEITNNNNENISLANSDSFVRNPFSQTMKISENDGQSVDMVETFNRLLGLEVEKNFYKKDEYHIVIGAKEIGNKKENYSIVWLADATRDASEKLDKIITEYDDIFVRADHRYINGQVANSDYMWKDIFVEMYERIFS